MAGWHLAACARVELGRVSGACDRWRVVEWSGSMVSNGCACCGRVDGDLRGLGGRGVSGGAVDHRVL